MMLANIMYIHSYNYSDITAALDNFMSAAAKISQSMQPAASQNIDGAALNEKLLSTERQFIGPGLPKRPW